MMRIYSVLIIVAACLVATPCQGKKKAIKKTHTTHVEVVSRGDAPKVVPGEWTIYKVEDKDVTGDDRPYITFDPANGRFYGNNGCNTINGDYKLTGNNKISMTNLITTMRLCPDESLQYHINAAIDKGRTYSITDKGRESYMTIYNDRGNPVLVLRKHNMDFVSGTWQVSSIGGNQISAEEYPELQLVIDIPELRVHGNTGCNILNGSLLIDPDKTDALQFTNMALTMRACPDAALETEMVLTLESVEKAVMSATNPSILILLDQNSKPIMTLTRIAVDK